MNGQPLFPTQPDQPVRHSRSGVHTRPAFLEIGYFQCTEGVAQGEEFGHGFGREVMYLTVHSVLHLLGYDHMDEGEMKRAMRAREEAIMARLRGGSATESE